MELRGLVTTIPNDAPVPASTEGQIRRLSDNSLVATVTTDAEGWYEYIQNGNPGPFRVYWNYSDVVKNSYSKVTGPSGAVDVAGIPLLFRSFSNGIIDGLGDDMICTASGSNMNISVALGAALVQGLIYDQRTVSTLTVTAANTQPRIDTIVVEVVPPGAGEDIEGRTEVKILVGTPAASPVAPTLTQTSSLWQFPMFNIAVGANVTVIGSDKLTDRRLFARATIPADSITPTELNDDALAVYAIKSSGSTINTVPVNRINFNADDFDISVNPSFDGKQMDIELAAPTSSGRAVFMPVSEFVATGPISSGSRTLVTMGVGPMPADVPYAVLVYFGVTVRNQVNSGTIIGRVNINGGTNRTHEFQNVGGVPRWCPVTQTAVITRSPSSSFNVVGSVQYSAADPSDIRAGWIQVVAVPASILAGA